MESEAIGNQTHWQLSKLPLVRKPIWLRQPDEAEWCYAKFIEYCQTDGAVAMQTWCKANEVAPQIAHRDRWRDRSEAFWTDISDELAVEVRRRVSTLRQRALDETFAYLQPRVVEEKTTVRNAAGEVKEKRVTKKTILPNANLIGIVLQNVLDSLSATADASAEDLARLFTEALQRSKGIDVGED